MQIVYGLLLVNGRKHPIYRKLAIPLPCSAPVSRLCAREHVVSLLKDYSKRSTAVPFFEEVLQLSTAFLMAGFAKKGKHVAFISFYTGLIKRIYRVHQTR